MRFIRDLIYIVQGKYYDYEQFRRNLENLRSSHDLPDKRLFSKMPETDLLVTNSSAGYENQVLNFYNPSDTTQTIELNNYYLKPLRKDVQRIALASVVGDSSYYINQLNQFFKETLAQLGVLYPNLTEEEKALIRRYPYESLRVAWHQFRSEFAMGRFFESGSIDGEADAFRHFVWAGLNLDQQNHFSAKNLYQEAFKSLKNKDLIVLKPTGEIPDDSSY
ncbi:MAG: hypothetical protein A2Z20_02300 [Bdellovibrionales bacterium RBG_16_40_8]|nr:MAG: hypothetical protein A2Z20_02300 [Bdellovibrionales bacterium RBG_16_40_8]